MNEKHVTEEQLVEMHVEPGTHSTLWEHVRGCPDCRHRGGTRSGRYHGLTERYQRDEHDHRRTRVTKPHQR